LTEPNFTGSSVKRVYVVLRKVIKIVNSESDIKSKQGLVQKGGGEEETKCPPRLEERTRKA